MIVDENKAVILRELVKLYDVCDNKELLDKCLESVFFEPVILKEDE